MPNHSRRTPPKARTRSARLWLDCLEDRAVPAVAYGLTAGNAIVRFDTATPGTVAATLSVSGLQPGETIQGIDVRPATGQLFALGIVNTPGTDEGRVYTINPTTGAATQVGTAPFSTALADGARYGFDFNPAADRIRIVNDADQSLRVNPNNGALAGTDTNLAHAGTEDVSGAAYDRDFAGTTLTTLFGIDPVTDELVRIGGIDGGPPEGSPNLGVTVTVGALGVNATTNSVGFDIEPGGAGFATLTDGATGLAGLYSVNLTTGAATLVGTVGNGATPVLGLVVLGQAVTGTAGNDVFVVSPNGTDPSSVVVARNGIVLGAFGNTAASPLSITGLAGNDTFTVASGVTLAAGTVLDGGADADTIDYSQTSAGAAVSLGTEHLFRSTLSGAQENPPTPSLATGTAVMTFNQAAGTFELRIEITGYPLANLTVSHLHVGAVGVNGPVIFDLGGPGSWTQDGTKIIRSVMGAPAAVFPAANVADLLAGNVYINVHSAAFPGGEVRGQVTLAAAPGTGNGVALTGFENAVGGSGADLLLGDGNANILQGGGGNDTILGKGGVDTLHGDGGNDLLIGGTGNDNMLGGNFPAGTLFGLSADGLSLVRFNASAPGTVTTTPISGLPNELFGIDVRPATGQLYGFGRGFNNQAQVYTINPVSGAASLVAGGQLVPSFQLLLGSFGFDFNPTVDRIRIVSDQDQNFRMHPDTGLVVDGDPATAGLQGDAAINPAGTLAGAAYTNNVAGATTTTLFAIDAGTDSLVRLGNPNPNDGVVTSVGALGVDADTALGFDIDSTGAAFAVLTVAGVPGLYTINLQTGAATLVGPVGGGTALTGLAALLAAATDDDRMVWNNGDNNDLMEGGLGTDAVEVNGSDGATGDQFTLAPNGTRLRFDRTNLVPFNLDIGTTESVLLHGGAGDDSITIGNLTGVTGVTTLTLAGGLGNDAVNASALPAGVVTTVNLAGGDGNDALTGSSGIDTLDGGVGNDTLVGRQGNDTFRGGAGDDTMVWNNGDNTDVMDGEAGTDTVQVNGSNTAGDAFDIDFNTGTGRVAFQRTNLVPFGLDVGTSERMEVNGQGGDDTVNVRGTPAGFVLVLTGGDGNDAFSLDSNGTATAGGTVDNVRGPVTIDGGAGTNTLAADDASDASGDNLTITPTQLGAGGTDTFFGAGGSLTYSNLTGITVNLGTTADVVTATPGTATLTLNGNGPTTAVGDVLAVTGGTATALAPATGGGTFTFTGAQPIAFTGFESVTPGGTIIGTVFIDLDGDGTQDADEPGQGGVSVTLDTDADGTVDRTATTDGFGTFRFDNLTPGTYRVTQTPPFGFTALGATSKDVTVASIATTNLSFTNRITAVPLPPPAGRLFAVGADAGGGPVVRVYNADGSLRFAFFAYAPDFTGGVRVASGDVNGDGTEDVITGAGLGGGSHVRVFSGTDGAELTQYSFFAFDPGLRNGVSVGAGDVNGDGFADIIVGAGIGGAPHVRAISGKDVTELASFFAFSSDTRGGVTVAGGDLNADGFDDIIAGSGIGGAPHVRAFSGKDQTELASFFAYSSDFRNGVTVGAGDVNGDGFLDIITGAGPGGGPHVKAFSGKDQTELASFFAFTGFSGGVRVTATDSDGDGTDEIVAGAGPGGFPNVKVFTAAGLELDSFFALEATFSGGVYVG